MPTPKKRRRPPIQTLPDWVLGRSDLTYSSRILLYFVLYNVNLRRRVTLTRLQDASGLAYETLRRALKALKLAGIINQELLGKTRYDGYAYVLNTERLKELGAPHVDSFFKGYKNVCFSKPSRSLRRAIHPPRADRLLRAPAVLRRQCNQILF